MLNKYKNTIWVKLAIAAIILFIAGSVLSLIQPVQAQIVPTTNTNTTQPDEFAIQDITIGNYLFNNISAMRNDSDAEGNQVFSWIETGSDSGCQTLYYQVYNRAGVAVSQANQVTQTCVGGTGITSPDIAFTPNGIAIVYGENTNVFLVEYNFDGNIQFEATQINDFPASAQNIQVRIVSEPTGNMPIGVSWLGCQDETCSTSLNNVEFQAVDAEIGQRINPDNIVLNSDTSNDTDSPNIGIGPTLFMITWQQKEADPTHTKILARGISGTDTTIVTPIITVSDTAHSEAQPDIAGISIKPDTSNPGPVEFAEKFFVTYTSTTSTSVGLIPLREILVKKILCDANYDGVQSTSYVCANTTRNGQDVIVRASAPGTDNYLPAISTFRNNKEIKRLAPYENTSIDYLTVAWLTLPYNLTTEPTPNLVAQSYTDTLVKSGSQIAVSTNYNDQLGAPAISSNQDGHFVINYHNSVTDARPCNPDLFCPPPSVTTMFGAKTYPSNYLLIGPEKSVNAPDSNEQVDPKVTINSDGKYVIVYSNSNGTDFDIIYALFDSNGNPIKNTTIATNTTEFDQINPHVEFFKESTDSPNFGKYVISWDGNGNGDADGVFYRIFNADGTPATDETMINQDPSTYIQTQSDMSVGKYGEIAFVYHQQSDVTNSIQLAFLNNTEGTIYRGVSSNDNPYSPHIALSPMADGSTGGTSTGKTKFAVGWTGDDGGKITTGYLSTPEDITFSSDPALNPGGEIYEMRGGYLEELATAYSVTNDAFFFTDSYINSDGRPNAEVRFYNSSYKTTLPSNADHQISAGIDPATGNIMTLGIKDSNYQSVWDRKKVLLSPADFLGDYMSGDTITNPSFSDTADVSTVNQYSTFINNYSNNTNVPFGFEPIGTESQIVPDGISVKAVQIFFDHDVSGNFTQGQYIIDSAAGAEGWVDLITPYYIIVEMPSFSGAFQPSDQLNNDPYNDTIASTTPGQIVWFANGEGSNFAVNDTVYNSNHNASATVVYSQTDFIFVTPISGSFLDTDNIAYFNQLGINTPDKIQYPSATIGQYGGTTVDGVLQPTWTQRGPSFATNKYFNYGQFVENLNVAYNTTPSDIQAQNGISVYANYYNTRSQRILLGGTTFPDANGIYQRIIENPFGIGQKQDLTPQTQQQINPGGKYIIVPSTIDFGNVSRGTTSSVNFRDLSPSCVQVTDLDGIDADLTVSVTNLVNIANSSQVIPKENISIENTDGQLPAISTTYSFSNPNDATLDPSTATGSETTSLGSTRTLFKKNNTNTGSWTFCPKAYLTVGDLIDSGIYSGTMTFTFI